MIIILLLTLINHIIAPATYLDGGSISISAIIDSSGADFRVEYKKSQWLGIIFA